MAIVATPINTKAGITLNKGSDPQTGKAITAQGSIPGVKSGADNQKVYNVAAAYSACAAYPVLRVYKTESVELTNE